MRPSDGEVGELPRGTWCNISGHNDHSHIIENKDLARTLADADNEGGTYTDGEEHVSG